MEKGFEEARTDWFGGIYDIDLSNIMEVGTEMGNI